MYQIPNNFLGLIPDIFTNAKEHLDQNEISAGVIEINGLDIVVHKDSNVADLMIIYSLKHELRRWRQGLNKREPK